MDILFTKIAIIFLVSWIIGTLVQDWRSKRPVKYYTLVSSDGYTYEMAYASRSLAVADAKAMAFSGTAYEHVVGGGRKMAFIW